MKYRIISFNNKFYVQIRRTYYKENQYGGGLTTSHEWEWLTGAEPSNYLSCPQFDELYGAGSVESAMTFLNACKILVQSTSTVKEGTI